MATARGKHICPCGKNVESSAKDSVQVLFWSRQNRAMKLVQMYCSFSHLAKYGSAWWDTTICDGDLLEPLTIRDKDRCQ